MILLDTCAIIWDALDSQQLGPSMKRTIEDADAQNSLLICDISLWEIAMLIRKGRLELNTSAASFLQLFLQSRNVRVLPISAQIAELSTIFGPEINKDPADRIIAATSIVHNARLLTADSNLIGNALIDTLWET